MNSICSLVQTIFTFYIMKDVTNASLSRYNNGFFVK